MDIIVHGRHLEITKAIKDYAEKKAGKVEKFFDRISKVQMILDIEGGKDHVVEMIVTVPRGPRLIGVVSKEDMYASIDSVVDKLERQLTKYKEKLKSRKKRKGIQPGLAEEEDVENEEIEYDWNEDN